MVSIEVSGFAIEIINIFILIAKTIVFVLMFFWDVFIHAKIVWDVLIQYWFPETLFGMFLYNIGTWKHCLGCLYNWRRCYSGSPIFKVPSGTLKMCQLHL